MAQARINVLHYHGVVLRIKLADALVLVVGSKARVGYLKDFVLIGKLRLLHLTAETVPILRRKVRAEELGVNRIKLRHIILKSRRTLTCQTLVVGIRTFRRSITVNVDAIDFNVLVIAHKVDGVSYLSQFACVLEEVHHNVRLVDTEAEISLALLGALLANFGERLHKSKSRHPCADIVDGGKVEIVEILLVAASADVLSGKQTQMV